MILQILNRLPIWKNALEKCTIPEKLCSVSTCICDHHFEEDSFASPLKKRLKPDACPSLFLEQLVNKKKAIFYLLNNKFL